MNAWCVECGRMPARILLKRGRLCGVCWHQARIYADLRMRFRHAE